MKHAEFCQYERAIRLQDPIRFIERVRDLLPAAGGNQRIAFEMADEEYENVFGEPRYSDYSSFRRCKAYHMAHTRLVRVNSGE